MDDIVAKARDFALKVLGRNQFYGLPKMENVKRTSLELADKFGGDIEVISISAYLSCITDTKKESVFDKDALQEIIDFLKRNKYPRGKITTIENIILLSDRSNWSEFKKPKTLEEKIIYDAKTAETISPIGILRKSLTIDTGKQDPKDMMRTLEAYIKDNYSSIFFTKTKNSIERIK